MFHFFVKTLCAQSIFKPSLAQNRYVASDRPRNQRVRSELKSNVLLSAGKYETKFLNK